MPAPHPPSRATRREFLQSGAALAGLAVPLGARPGTLREEREDLLDRAYERVDARTPDASFHRSNHVPMVAEALCVLGRADAIAGWLDEHLERFEPAPAARTPLVADDWRAAFGRPERFPDWREHFRRELGADDWRAVLRRWIPHLVPGLAGSATHGVIRCGHAARALGVRDNAVRRAELANGLAYWAVSYEELPWDGSLAPEASVAAALARVVPRRPALAPPRGNIVTGLRALSATPSFRPVAGLVDAADPARTLSEMAVAFARLYLANPEHRIAFTHALTAPSALRLLAPHLDEECVVRATRHAWQAAAGLYVVYGDPLRKPPPARAVPERESLVAAAVANGAVHAIKLTEACLREVDLAHEPILLQAAHDAAEELSG